MKKRLISFLLAVCMMISLMPQVVLAAPGDGIGTVLAHDVCGIENAVPWLEKTAETTTVKVTNFNDLAAAVANSTVTDIVLTTDKAEDTWEWNQTLIINRTVHISVEQDKTIMLKRAESFVKDESNLFKFEGNDGQLILGSGTLTWTGKDEQSAYQAGTYEITPAGGQLIIDGGAVWEPTDTDITAYFIDEDGERQPYKNNGLTGNALISCANGTLSIWNGVTLQNNRLTFRGRKGSAIWLGNTDKDHCPTLNLYGGVVQWCSTQVGEDGSGAIYCGNAITWTLYESDSYGTVNIFAGGVNHNANYDSNRDYGWSNSHCAGDGTGIALDAATLNLYGGSVSYNCGDDRCTSDGAAADGGGIGGRVGAQLNLYGGEISHNWTGGFGGGVCLWNSKAELAGTRITNNIAGFGGGVAIAGCSGGNEIAVDKEDVFSQLTMTGGIIAYNEATNVGAHRENSGVGGGICAGTATRPNGSVLDLQGGEIYQNKANNGGGVAAYAGRITALKMSGDAAITGNTAYQKGGGAYFVNHRAGYMSGFWKGTGEYDNQGNEKKIVEEVIKPSMIHPLLEMSGQARIDTDNSVYFENVLTATEDGKTEATVQVPVRVNGRLLSDGTVAVLEFADGFWKEADDKSNEKVNHAHAVATEKIVEFGQNLDIQENKFSLDSSVWYLKADKTDMGEVSGYLELQQYDELPQYSIRNGTPVEIQETTREGKTVKKLYYRIYDSLAAAFAEAADGDTLYIFYNTNVKIPAVVDGKHLTLLAESSSSAGVAASLSGGTCNFDQTHMDEYGYYIMSGAFLKYVGESTPAEGDTGDRYSVDTETKKATAEKSGNYILDGNEYNVRNDYTVTLDSTLTLNDTDTADKSTAAIIVKNKGNLEIGQTTTVGIGYGALTFDGYAYYPVNGPMLKIDKDSQATVHSGITLKKHTNYSQTYPGLVYNAGKFTMESGSSIQGSVSPKAGAVYVAGGGTFNLNGGSLTGNTGAMPRWGKAAADGKDAEGTGDDLYHGQAKYYYGAGAVNVEAGGTFEMTGGAISGNRGEWGAVANLGGTMKLTGGAISGNAAVIGNGKETGIKAYNLTINGYKEGTNGEEPAMRENPGYGGGLYLGSKDGKTSLGGVSITGNWAQKNGGGIAECGGQLDFAGGGSTVITENTAADLGGGIFAGNGVDVSTNVTLARNTAKTGGGLAALGKAGQTTKVTISSNVSSNTATFGGGVYAGAYSEVTISNASVQDNTADYGGGAYVDCAKTLVDSAESTTDLVHPGRNITLNKESTDDDAKAQLGADVDGSYGKLILDKARINNNHLTKTGNDVTIGFGGGVYNRGDLILQAGAYVSANDRLYLEWGHLVTLADGYAAAGQTTEDKLTINSRQTALGTDVIKMENPDQFGKLLTKGQEKTAHYAGIPMALADTPEKNIIELNYHTIYYYDRLATTDGLDSHVVTDMVVPGNPYTILGWDAVNNLASDEKLQAPDGKSLSNWKVATKDVNGNLTVSEEGGYTAGATYPATNDLYLVADFTTNNYLAVMLNNVEGQAKVTDNDPRLGSVKLTDKDGEMTSTSDGIQSYFSKNMEIQLIVNSVTDDAGHQKGVLQSLELYEYDRPLTSGMAMSDNKDEITYGANVYKKRAVATFDTVDLTVSSGEKTTYTTSTPNGWRAAQAGDTLPEEQFKCENGVLSYVGGDKHFLVVATFAEPSVELKMTDKDGNVVHLEYYDTMRQAFTRMANVISTDNSTVWGPSTITPLKADQTEGAQPNTNGVVYYYGKNADQTATPVDNSFGNAKDVDVVFDLNNFTMDFQNVPQQFMSQYNLTVKNGAIVSRVTAAKDGAAYSSLFVVKDGGRLTLENARLVDDQSAYNVILGQNGNMTVDQASQAGKVLLEGKDTRITAANPENWTENTTGENGNTYTATLYTDLASLVTKHPDKDGNGQIIMEGQTDTTRQVINLTNAAKSSAGHNVRSHFALEDSVTSSENDKVNDAPYWFITTGGYLYPRVTDVIPQLVCQAHDQATEGEQVRKETPTTDDNNKEYDEAKTSWYPVYYLYERDYGYNNTVHPLSIVTTLRDAYGNRVVNAAGGIVTVTMTLMENGEKNRVLTARAQVDNGTIEKRPAGTATYYGTDANPTFPVSENDYYLTGSFTGIGEYAASYSDYWKVNDPNRTDNNMTYVSGLSKLKIDEKSLSDPSVVITSVTPSSAGYIGPKGAEAGNTSRAGTVRVRDNNTNLNLTSGDDLQNYYRKLTTEDRGDANKAGGGYWYADDVYYTATGSWYGPELPTGATVGKIDGQAVGTYSVEVAAIKDGALQSINYDGISGWREKIFQITPYTSRLNTTMTNNIVANVDDATSVQTAIQNVINTLTITDIYGNIVETNEVTYKFVPADSNAQVDANGWPCAEGLYSIEIHPYDTGDVVSVVTQTLAGGQPTDDLNYSKVATGYQALLITKNPLTMEIQVRNGTEETWQSGIALKVPYTGTIYWDSSVKTYDQGENGDHLQVVKNGESETRLLTTEYSLQVGLPDDPALNAGGHVLVATDGSGQYVAIGRIEIQQNQIADVKIEPESDVYTGKRMEPKLTVTGSGGKTLVEGRDYTVSMVMQDAEGKDVATGTILNASTYTITVAGKGNYGGETKTVTFTVKPKDIGADATDNKIKVNVDVSTYNLGDGSTRPRAVLTYNGLVLSPDADYGQAFDPPDSLSPKTITFTGRGNYTGTRTVQIETVELPKADLTIIDANNSYTYQATDLFGYLDFNDLTFTESREASDRDIKSFANYDVSIASVADYWTNQENPPFETAEGKILDADAYIVKMTEKASGRTGYFFVRIAPRAVTITVKAQEKVFGEAKPEYPYTTNLVTLVGSSKASEPHGEINLDTGFFARDEVSGELYRAEGENVGSYYYALNTFSAGDNYTLTVSNETQFTIVPKSLSYVDDDGNPDPNQIADKIAVDWDKQVEYTGYPVLPLNSVTYRAGLEEMGTQTLHENADYTLTYYVKNSDGWTALSAAPISVGEYKLEIEGIGNYTNAVEVEFQVVASGNDLTVSLDNSKITYRAADYHPAVTVKTTGGAVLNSNSYQLTYSFIDTTGAAHGGVQEFKPTTTFRDAGTYTIYANGTGNYSGAYGTATFTIAPKSLASPEDDTKDGTQGVQIDQIANEGYTGQTITFPEGLGEDSVTYSGLITGGLTEAERLVYHKDYDLTYMDNTNAGTATVVLVGKGNYTGSRAVTFTINSKEIYVDVKNATKTYGEADPAEYHCTVYEAVRDDTGTIIGYKELDDSGIKLTGKPGREDISEDVGTYSLNVGTLSASGNYTIHLKPVDGTTDIMPTLTIEPKKLSENNTDPAERIVATIPYVEAKTGATWPVPTVTYWKAAGSEKLTAEHFTIQYYKVNDDGSESPVDASTGPEAPTDIGKYYALVTARDDTNYSQEFKLNFMVVKEGSYLSLVAAPESEIYDPAGKPISLTAKYGETDVTAHGNTTYQVTCYSSGTPQAIEVEKSGDTATFTAKDAGTYVITAEYVDGKTIAYGSTTVVINPKDIDTVAAADIPTQDYTGDGVTLPDEILSGLLTDGSTKLVPGTDFIVSYRNNVGPNAEAEAIITGMGNYTGTRTVHFEIGSMQFSLHYDANGGNSAAPETQHSKEDFYVASGIGMTHDKAELDGKSIPVLFVGWSTTTDDGKIYRKGDQLPVDTMVYPGQTLIPTVPTTTLYAIWGYDADDNGKPDVAQGTIKVLYCAGGATGTVPVDDKTYLVGDMAIAKDNGSLSYTKGGKKYVFMGWTATDPGDGNAHAADTLAQYMSMSVTAAGQTFYVGNSGNGHFNLYSVWGIDADNNGTADFLDGNVALFYDANGGINAPGAQTGKAGKDTTLSTDTPTRTGALFLGWTENRHAGLLTEAPTEDTVGTIYPAGAAYRLPSNGAISVTLYALWAENKNNNDKPDYEEDTYTVTYSVDGVINKVTDSNNYLEGQTVTLKDGSGLTKAGYVFDGWSLTENGEKIEGSTYTMGTQNVTFYAVWQAEARYSVTYDANEPTTGTAPVDNKTYLPGETVTVADGTGLTKTGALFAGWSTTQYPDILSDLSTVNVLYGANSSFLMGTDHVTLFAVWGTPEAMDVYYKLDFQLGSIVTRNVAATMPSPMFFQTGNTVNIKAIQPYDVSGGYVFLGWSDAADSTNPITEDNITITANTTLYALFTTDSREVYTHAGTGGSITSTDSSTVDYGGSYTFQVTVNSGYRLDKVTVNGIEVQLESGNRFTIDNITKDQYVMATFTSTSGGGSSIPDPTPTPTPTPSPKPITPEDTGVSRLLNTKDHNAFMVGYATGDFGPDDSITRAEVAQMFYNLLLNKDVEITVRFQDVSDEAWYAKAVNTLASLGIIQGIGDDQYAPERAITRAEFATIATRFAKSTTAAKTNFVDVPVTHWAYQYINVAASYGWVDGYGGNRFGPDDLITRAQAATMVNRMLGRLCDRDAIDRGESRTFPDVSPSHWGWYQIAEATTDHEFTISKDYLSETWRK